MKYIYLLQGLLFVVGVIRCLNAHEEELFLRANNLYKKRLYQDALDTYISIQHKGEAVWRNMGNCAYYMDDSAHAIIYWRRAQQNAPIDRFYEIENQIAQMHSERCITASSNSWLWDIVQYLARLTYNFPLGIIQVFFLLIWCFLWLLFIFFAATRFRVAILFGLCCCSGLFLYARYVYEARKVAIVTTTAQVYPGMKSNFEKKGQLKYAAEELVQEQRSDWYKIKSGSLSGWVEAKCIEIV